MSHYLIISLRCTKDRTMIFWAIGSYFVIWRKGRGRRWRQGCERLSNFIAVVWGTGPGRGKTPLVAWLEEEEQSVCSNIRRWANDGRGMKNRTHNSHQRAEAGRNVTDVVITFDVPHYNLPRRSPLFKWDSHLSNVIMMTRAPPLDDVNLWPMVLCKNFFHVIVRIGH